MVSWVSSIRPPSFPVRYLFSSFNTLCFMLISSYALIFALLGGISCEIPPPINRSCCKHPIDSKEPHPFKRSEKKNFESRADDRILPNDPGISRLDTSIAPLDRLLLIALDGKKLKNEIDLKSAVIIYSWKVAWKRLKGAHLCPLELCSVAEQFLEYVARRLFNKLEGTKEMISLEKRLSDTYLAFFGLGPLAAQLTVDEMHLKRYVLGLEAAIASTER